MIIIKIKHDFRTVVAKDNRPSEGPTHTVPSKTLNSKVVKLTKQLHFIKNVPNYIKLRETRHNCVILSWRCLGVIICNKFAFIGITCLCSIFGNHFKLKQYTASVQSRVRFMRDHALIFKITHSEKSSASFSRTHLSKSRTEFEAVRFLHNENLNDSDIRMAIFDWISRIFVDVTSCLYESFHVGKFRLSWVYAELATEFPKIAL